MTEKEKARNRLLTLAKQFVKTNQDVLFFECKGKKYSVSLDSWEKMEQEFREKYGEELT